MPSTVACRGDACGRGVLLGPSPLAALRLPLRRGLVSLTRRLGHGLALGGLLLGAWSLPAQGPPAAPLPVGPAYPGIPEVPADTGRLVHGWHDFSRYRWGGPLDMCLSAVQRATAVVWRRRDLDTALASVSTHVPLPPAARQIAERCGLPQQLPAALQQGRRGQGGWTDFLPTYVAALVLGQDSAATALLTGYLAHAPSPWAQALVLGSIWGPNIGGPWGTERAAHPARPGLVERDRALAESLAFQPLGRDTLGAKALQGTAVSLLLATGQWLADYWWHMGDTAQVRAQYERIVATTTKLWAAQLLPFRPDDQLAGPQWTLLDLAILEHGVRSREVVNVLTRFARLMLRDSTARGRVPSELLFLNKPFVWPETPYWYSAAGAPVPPPASGGTSSAAAVVPGKVTLIWDPGEDDHRLLGGGGQAFAGERYAHIVGLLHRIMAKYGPEGLQLVVIEHTRGMAHGLGAVESVQEAPAIRQLYQEQFGFSAAVVVDTVRYRTLPDGRRNDAYTPWERRYIDFPVPEYRPCSPYGDCYPLEAMLLDKHGTLQAFGSQIPWIRGSNEDPLLELFIQKLLKEP